RIAPPSTRSAHGTPASAPSLRTDSATSELISSTSRVPFDVEGHPLPIGGRREHVEVPIDLLPAHVRRELLAHLRVEARRVLLVPLLQRLPHPRLQRREALAELHPPALHVLVDPEVRHRHALRS